MSNCCEHSHAECGDTAVIIRPAKCDHVDTLADIKKLLDKFGELKTPYIGENGNWYYYDPEKLNWVDSGIKAEGPQGDKGEVGEQGPQGEKGDKGDTGETGLKGESGINIADIKVTAASAIPSGWKVCDGAALSASEYPELFAAIGYTFGGNNDNFNLPDMKGKVIVGQDDSQNEFNTLGKIDGEKNHTLSVNEMPSHSHDYTDTGATSVKVSWSATGDERLAGSPSASTTRSVTAAGSNQSHNNLQPYIVLNYIIYTGK